MLLLFTRLRMIRSGFALLLRLAALAGLPLCYHRVLPPLWITPQVSGRRSKSPSDLFVANHSPISHISIYGCRHPRSFVRKSEVGAAVFGCWRSDTAVFVIGLLAHIPFGMPPPLGKRLEAGDR